MIVSTTLGNAYVNRLREYRDRALTESSRGDDIVHLGKFSMGSYFAAWELEMGGRAFLCDSGLWHGAKRLVARTTTLHLRHGEIQQEANVEADLYRMDLDTKKPSVEVFSTIESEGPTRLDTLRGMYYRRFDREYGLSTFAESEPKGVLLFDEMLRGASGCFLPIDHPGNDGIG
jgi:hypothetical protein